MFSGGIETESSNMKWVNDLQYIEVGTLLTDFPEILRLAFWEPNGWALTNLRDIVPNVNIVLEKIIKVATK